MINSYINAETPATSKPTPKPGTTIPKPKPGSSKVEGWDGLTDGWDGNESELTGI